MTKTSTFALGIALASSIFLASGAAQAATTTLGFDTAADCNTADVTITSTGTRGNCDISVSPAGSNALVQQGQFDSYWTAEFSSLVSNVSIDLGDFNADADDLFLWAWDENGNDLGFVLQDLDPSFSGMVTLNLALAGIKWVSFGTIGNLGLGGIFADNLTFTTDDVSKVPVPAALPLLLAGLGGLGVLGLGRKRKTAKA